MNVGKLGKLASLALLAGGAATALNSRLRTREPLEPPLEGEERTCRWRGMNVAYTEAGDPADPTVLFFHGISAAGSSGEWRENFADLSEDYHVVAPDLPGYGRSDRPPLRYSAALYEDFVRDFLAQYETPRVIASSLSAAYVTDAVQTVVGEMADGEEPSFRGLVFVCPTTTAGPTPPKAWLRELLRTPVVGETLFNGLVSRPAIRYFNADHGYDDPASVDDEWIEYGWKTSHVAGARYAPASFLAGYLNSGIDLGPALRDAVDAGVPTTLVWGRESAITPLSGGRDLADEADANLVVFDRAKLLPHVEFPGQFHEVVRETFDEADRETLDES